jgi:uncharacterized iron-regulated membrane protein
MEAKSTGPAIDSLALAEQIEQRYPEVLVTYVPLAPEEPGKSLPFGVEPRRNPETGRLYEPGFNQVFVDPATGEELGKREWGAVWPITKETFVSFLYVFHYSLHLPEMWGTDRWGIWLLGIIAIVWTLDCFTGFYLTLPPRRRSRTTTVNDDGDVARSWWQRWRPAWLVRWRGGATKLNFDLHRAFSLWTWGLLFVVAFTAFSLNLYFEVFYPLMSKVSQVTPTPFEQRAPNDKHDPWGIYGVQFYEQGDGHGAGGVGHHELYFDGVDGRMLGDRQPWRGTAADLFVQAQFPLHSGRILGLPGRILISLLGLVVATLSVTGVVIWWKKRRARVFSERRAAGYLPANAEAMN